MDWRLNAGVSRGWGIFMRISIRALGFSLGRTALSPTGSPAFTAQDKWICCPPFSNFKGQFDNGGRKEGVLATCQKWETFHLSISKIKFSIFCTQTSLVCRHELSLRFMNLAIPNLYIKNDIFLILL